MIHARAITWASLVGGGLVAKREGREVDIYDRFAWRPHEVDVDLLLISPESLPSAAQLEQIAQAAGDQSPPTGSTNVWLDAPSGGTAVWTANVNNSAHVSLFTSEEMTQSNPAPIVCVYQPASKQG